jgi:hypothetical protein
MRLKGVHHIELSVLNYEESIGAGKNQSGRGFEIRWEKGFLK